MKTSLWIPVVLLSCTGNKNQTETNTSLRNNATKISDVRPITQTRYDQQVEAGNCYWQIMARDTFGVSFLTMGAAVAGKLSFDNYEKDGSSGNVTGTTYGDILKLCIASNQKE